MRLPKHASVAAGIVAILLLTAASVQQAAPAASNEIEPPVKVFKPKVLGTGSTKQINSLLITLTRPNGGNTESTASKELALPISLEKIGGVELSGEKAIPVEIHRAARRALQDRHQDRRSVSGQLI